MYGSLCDEYIAQGISVIPVLGKRVKIANFGQYSHRLPTKIEIELFKKVHGKRNIGLMLGPVHRLMGIDIDTDDKKVIGMIDSVTPLTPCEKFGSKGKTKFFRGNFKSNEMMFNLKHGCMLEFLCTSKQTVIPPSTHPKTKKNYKWLSSSLLSEIKNIPEITQDALDEIKDWMLKKYQVVGFKKYLQSKSGVYR